MAATIYTHKRNLQRTMHFLKENDHSAAEIHASIHEGFRKDAVNAGCEPVEHFKESD